MSDPTMVLEMGAQVVTAPPADVTLFEDRAQVVRRGRVELPAGACTLVIEGVAPVLADRTLSAKLIGAPAGAQVIEARAHRRRLVSTPQRAGELRELEEQLRAARLDEQRAKNDILERNVELGTLTDALTRTADEVAQEAAWGRGGAAEWLEHLDGVRTRQAGLREEQARAQSRLCRLEQRRADLESRVASVARADDDLRCEVLVRITSPAAGACDLTCTYTVPGACWRPAHTARLTGAKVELATDGCVWQNTGEDWNAVQLHFSTQRLERGTEPPPLTSDVVATQRKQATMVVETREQEIQTTGLGGGGRAAEEVPGIDDGGQTRHLDARAPATVPSDGRPHRVPIGSFESSAKAALVLMGELSAAVHLRTEQSNTSKIPVLAGPVDLVRDSGYCGATRVLFVAPGETFELGWGPDAAIRVHRDVSRIDEEPSLLGALSSWTSRDHRVRVRLSNLGDEARSIQVTERVPVSEVEKVQIVPEAPETTGQQTPDRDGFVRWTVPLSAYGHSELKLRYRVRKHKDVLER